VYIYYPCSPSLKYNISKLASFILAYQSENSCKYFLCIYICVAMTTYLNWLPSLSIGTYFGYTGENSENNKQPSSDSSIQTTQSENNKMFGFWSEMFGKAPKIEKYSPENIR
jgi:hypothetical protein